MGALTVGGRQLARGDEAATQEGLLVLAVEQDDFHGLILVLAEQHADFRMAGAFIHGKPLPIDAMPVQGVQRLSQAWEQGLFELVKLEEGGIVRPAEGLAFAFDDGENFLAEGEMPAQVGGNLLGRTQGVPTAAAGGMLLAPLRS
jgi:hypothetical protein